MDALTFLSKIHADQISLAALVTFGIISIIRGWIVPRQVVLDRIADKDKAIATLTSERDNYKSAWEVARDANFESIAQIGKMVTAGEATTRLIDAMRVEFQRSGIRLPDEGQ